MSIDYDKWMSELRSLSLPKEPPENYLSVVQIEKETGYSQSMIRSKLKKAKNVRVAKYNNRGIATAYHVEDVIKILKMKASD